MIDHRANSSAFRSRFGPWALIAGASQGLGAEYAAQLAAMGFNLVLVARTAGRLASLTDNLSARFGIQALPVPADLSRPDAVDEIVRQVADREIGLLICNAAYSVVGEFFETSLEEHLKEIDTNCRTPLILVYTFGQLMRARQRGGIILMSSLSSSQGSPLVANYAATKAFSLVLGEGLWDELSRAGVAALVCTPSSISTPGYLASLPARKGKNAMQPTSPRQVAVETLAALGKQSSVIPGWPNRLAAFMMRRLLPRQTAIRLMGRVLRGMYAG